MITVAVNPRNTSQQCSNCDAIVKKSLSTRTHICACNTVLCRDENAARNILALGLTTVGHTGCQARGDDNQYSIRKGGRASCVAEPGNSNCEVGIPALKGRGGCQTDFRLLVTEFRSAERLSSDELGSIRAPN